MGAANDITRKHCLLHECRIASMPRRPPSPHVLLTRRPRRRERLPCATLRSCRMPFHIPRLARASLHACGVRRCGPHCWVAPQCPKFVRRVPHLQTALPIHRRKRLASLLPAGAPRLARPPPAALRGVAPRDGVSSRRAMLHRALPARLPPVLRRATMGPALLRRAAMSTDACAAPQMRILL